MGLTYVVVLQEAEEHVGYNDVREQEFDDVEDAVSVAREWKREALATGWVEVRVKGWESK